jgi:protein-tyrosine phosphatase
VTPTLPAPTGTPYRVGFVCLGNICRSPMADVVLRRLLDEAGLARQVRVDSCGTGPWHVGEPMDARAAAHLSARGYDPAAHRGQQFDATWLAHDLLLAMDAANLAVISDDAGPSDRVRLFRSFDPLAGSGPTPDVPDPYYGGDQGFTEVLAMVERTCDQLVAGLHRLDL